MEYFRDNYSNRMYERRGEYIWDINGNRCFEIRDNYIWETAIGCLRLGGIIYGTHRVIALQKCEGIIFGMLMGIGLGRFIKKLIF